MFSSVFTQGNYPPRTQINIFPSHLLSIAPFPTRGRSHCIMWSRGCVISCHPALLQQLLRTLYFRGLLLPSPGWGGQTVQLQRHTIQLTEQQKQMLQNMNMQDKNLFIQKLSRVSKASFLCRNCHSGRGILFVHFFQDFSVGVKGVRCPPYSLLIINPKIV